MPFPISYNRLINRSFDSICYIRRQKFWSSAEGSDPVVLKVLIQWRKFLSDDDTDEGIFSGNRQTSLK